VFKLFPFSVFFSAWFLYAGFAVFVLEKARDRCSTTTLFTLATGRCQSLALSLYLWAWSFGITSLWVV